MNRLALPSELDKVCTANHRGPETDDWLGMMDQDGESFPAVHRSEGKGGIRATEPSG